MVQECAVLVTGVKICVTVVRQTASMVVKIIVVIIVGPRSDSNLVRETTVIGSGEGGQSKGYMSGLLSVGVSEIVTS